MTPFLLSLICLFILLLRLCLLQSFHFWNWVNFMILPQKLLLSECVSIYKNFILLVFLGNNQKLPNTRIFFSKKFYCRNRNTCRSDRFCSNLKKSFSVSPLPFQMKHYFDFIVRSALASFEALPQFHLKHCFRFMFVWIDVVTTVPLFEQVNFWRHQLYWPPRWRWRRPTGNGHFQLTEFDSNFNPTDGRSSKQS